MSTINSWNNKIASANSVITLNSGSNDINIGTDNATNNINIGTETNTSRMVTIGNVSDASEVKIRAGNGADAVLIQSAGGTAIFTASIDGEVLIGSGGGSGQTQVLAGAGGVLIEGGPVILTSGGIAGGPLVVGSLTLSDETIEIGSDTDNDNSSFISIGNNIGASSITLTCGSGGMKAIGIAGTSVSNKNYVTLDTSTGQLGTDGGPSSGVTTIDGNTGSATGSTITLESVEGSPFFTASSSSVDLTFTSPDGNFNTIIGSRSNYASMSGAGNTSVGDFAFASILGGDLNTAMGQSSLGFITSGEGNTAYGAQSGGGGLDTGNYNLLLGYNAGVNYTGSESSNIIIANSNSGSGVTGESNTLRIGLGSGTGNGEISTAYISGIASVSVSNKEYVTINTTTGQLGSDAGPSGGGITTINGDTGFATGTTITFSGDGGFNYAGSSVRFIGNVSNDEIDLLVSDSNSNTFIGFSSGTPTASGANNTSLGNLSLTTITSGNSNSALGDSSLGNFESGNANVSLGYQSGINLVSGSNNVIVGSGSAGAYTTSESDNIIIGQGVTGVVGESNVTRIGAGGIQTSCYIDGIASVSVSNKQYVSIDTTTGQLGSDAGPLGFSWNDVTAASATLAASNGYVANRSSLVTFTMPTNSNLGDTIKIVGKGTGLWSVVHGTGQSINFGALATTTSTGQLNATNKNDCITLVCTTASGSAPIFTVVESIGNITVL